MAITIPKEEDQGRKSKETPPTTGATTKVPASSISPARYWCDGTVVEGGRVLMRDAWNTALYMHILVLSTAKVSGDPRRRMSGSTRTACGTELESFLRKEGITALLFAGVNTDQDASATSSPPFAQEA
ncbi:hypothetical protein VTN02DRAFT_3788 [Thermoascus thermophilus]